MRKVAWSALLLAGIAAEGCTTIRAAHGGTELLPNQLVDQVAFEHGCTADRIVYLKGYEGIVDLDVCGRVRRYRCGKGFCADQTYAFPPDVLPRPVQPPGGTPVAAGTPSPGGPVRCQTSADCPVGVCIERWCRR